MAVIKGTNGADNLVSKNIFADTLYGYDGNDTLDGGFGSNTLIGGLGDDLYVLHGSSEVVVEKAGEGRDTVQAGFSIDLRKAAYTNIEDVVLTGVLASRIDGSAEGNFLTGNAGNNKIFGHDGDDGLFGMAGNDSLDGGNGNDFLYGGTGRDTLVGGAGDDLLDGGEGNDSMLGGAGNDTYVLSSASDVVVEAANAGSDTVEVTYAGDVSLGKWANVENLTMSAGGATKITGTSAANVLRGNDDGDVIEGLDGDDTLIDGYGNDSLLGGAGNDTLSRSGGNDTLMGGAGNDTYDLPIMSGTVLINDTDGANDRVDLSANYAAKDLLFSRAGDDLTVKVAYGGVLTIQSYFAEGANSVESLVTRDKTFSRADVLAAVAPGHVIHGTDGDDDLTAPDNAGPDTLIGGLGNDTYHIASPWDVVVENAGEGTDTIYATLAAGTIYNLGVAAAHVENVIATSGSGSNVTLMGNDLDNVLQDLSTGGAALIGGKGNDTLMGGTGGNYYDLRRGDGQDVIEDAGGAGDVLGLYVNKSDLAAQRSGQDLILKIRDTQDQVTIKRFFDGPTNGPDVFYTLDSGSNYLSHADLEAMSQPGVVSNQSVNVLLQAMAAGGAPVGSFTTLPTSSEVSSNTLFFA